jgi:hypothetical protein
MVIRAVRAGRSRPRCDRLRGRLLTIGIDPTFRYSPNGPSGGWGSPAASIDQSPTTLTTWALRRASVLVLNRMALSRSPHRAGTTDRSHMVALPLRTAITNILYPRSSVADTWPLALASLDRYHAAAIRPDDGQSQDRDARRPAVAPIRHRREEFAARFARNHNRVDRPGGRYTNRRSRKIA